MIAAVGERDLKRNKQVRIRKMLLFYEKQFTENSIFSILTEYSEAVIVESVSGCLKLSPLTVPFVGLVDQFHNWLQSLLK